MFELVGYNNEIRHGCHVGAGFGEAILIRVICSRSHRNRRADGSTSLAFLTRKVVNTNLVAIKQ